MEKILTISIAAYNVESYIKKALDSIIDSNSIDDVEIFVIDDGGSDSTFSIALQYQSLYPNSITAVHKENGGYGSTVNYGIQHASGKYFKLLDGDDWFDSSELYSLVENLKRVDEDMIVSKFKRVFESDGSEEIRNQIEELPFRSGQLNDLDISDWFTNAAIVYKTEVLKLAEVLLSEKCFYTDIEYDLLPLQKVVTIRIIDCCPYCYRIGREGQSVSLEGIKKHYKDQYKVLDRLCNNYRDTLLNIKNGKQKYILNYIGRRVQNQIFNVLILDINEEHRIEARQYLDRIRGEFPNIYQKVLESKIIKTLETCRFVYPAYIIAHYLSLRKFKY